MMSSSGTARRWRVKPQVRDHGAEWPLGRLERPAGRIHDGVCEGGPPGLGSRLTQRRRKLRRRALICAGGVALGAPARCRLTDAATQTSESGTDPPCPDRAERGRELVSEHEGDLVLAGVLCMSYYACPRHQAAGPDAACEQGIPVAADVFWLLPLLESMLHSKGLEKSLRDADFPRHWAQLQASARGRRSPLAAESVVVRWTIDEFHEYAKAGWRWAREEPGRLPMFRGILVAGEEVICADSVKTSLLLEVVEEMEDGTWHDFKKIERELGKRVGQAVESGTVLEMLRRLAGHGWIEMNESGVRMSDTEEQFHSACRRQ